MKWISLVRSSNNESSMRTCIIFISTFLIGTVTYWAPAVNAANPCSPDEQIKSARYFDNNGNRLASASGPMPKFCPRSSTVPRYNECRKTGFDPAALFIQENKQMIRHALAQSHRVYETYSEEFLPYTRQARDYERFGHLFDGPGNSNQSGGRPDADNGEGRFGHDRREYLISRRGEPVKFTYQPSIPNRGETVSYMHIGSGAVFSLSYVSRPREARDVLVLAFKGSGFSTPESDFIEDNRKQELGLESRKYAFAQELGLSLADLLEKNGDGCKVAILFTGHSLGGGLAIYSGAASRQRCSRRLDSILTFNTARPPTDRARDLSMKQNSVGLLVDFAAQNDVIQRARIFNADEVIRALGRNAQVLRFGSIDVPGVTSIGAHSLDNFGQVIEETLDKVPNPGHRIPAGAAKNLCEWYTPR